MVLAIATCLGVFSVTALAAPYDAESSNGIMAGELRVDGWHLVGNDWYYYQNGVPLMGEHMINGRWYMLIPEQGGRMATGWLSYGNGDWKYFVPSGGNAGAMYIQQWLYDGGYWYWFRAGGWMARNEWALTDDGYWYFDNNGHCGRI